MIQARFANSLSLDVHGEDWRGEMGGVQEVVAVIQVQGGPWTRWVSAGIGRTEEIPHLLWSGTCIPQ